MLNQSSKVSVIIVNNNGKNFLKSCLKSLEAQSFLPQEIIVVDNASTDGSIRMLQEEFPKVIVISNRENLYFCTAHNQGIDVSQGEFVLCLNNDIVLDKNFIKYLIENRDFDLRIGMWGGKLLRMDMQTIDTTGLFLARCRKPVERGYGKKDNGQFNKKGYVFGIGGAAILFRRKMLDEIKINGEYFDEEFNIFYDDLDLCWRAHRFGWKAYYVPGALAYHQRGATVQTQTPKLKILNKFHFTHLVIEFQSRVIRNRYLTIIKNDSLKGFLANFIFILYYDIMLWSYILFFQPKIILQLFKFKNSFKKSFEKRKIILEKIKLLEK